LEFHSDQFSLYICLLTSFEIVFSKITLDFLSIGSYSNKQKTPSFIILTEI
jgi:hypothetical protein